MASNRPLFDDEELPLWLKNGGITHAGRSGTPQQSNAPQPSQASPVPAEDLSWLDEQTQQAPAPAFDDTSFNNSAPWMQDAVPADATPTASGDLPPWMQNVAPAEQASPAAQSGDVPPWMQDAAPADATPAASGDLPPWMQNAAPAEPASSIQSEESPPWMQDVTPASPAASSPISADLPDWAQDEAPQASGTGSQSAQGAGLTGMLPWRQGVSDANAAQDDPFADIGDTSDTPWQPSAPIASEPVQQEQAFDDSWLQTEDVSPSSPEPESAPEPEPEPAKPSGTIKRLASIAPQAEPAALAPEPEPQPVAAATPEDDLSWLDEAIQEAPAATPELVNAAASPTPPPQPPEPAPKQVRPLSALPSLQPQASQSDNPPSDNVPAEPPKSRPAIRKLSPAAPAQPEQPAQPAPRPAIKKLGGTPPPQQPAQPDLSNMTYEEWEQSQLEKEQAAQADPNDKLLDEVPDWFGGAGTESPAQGAAPGGAEFMPEWFVGQEEKSTDAAPDWFTNMDLNSTSLVGPDTVQTPQNAGPASRPAAPAASADDVPDWFKGSAEGVGDLDFNAMFVSDAPPEPPPSSSKLALKLSELAPEPAPQPPSQPEPTPAAAAIEPTTEPVAQAAPPEIPVQPPPEPVTAQAPTPEPPAQPQPVSAPAAEEPDLDWMSDMPDLDDLVATEAEQTPEPTHYQPARTSTPAEPIAARSAEPDWFADTAQPEPAGSDDPLDWMDQGPTDTAQAEPAAAEADDLPDWMGAAAPAEAATPAAQSGSEDWMGSLPTELASTPASSSTPDAEEADLPDWMRNLGPTEAAAPTQQQPAPAAPQGSEIDWLADFAALSPEDQQPAQAVQSDTPAASELDWLADAATEGAGGDSLDLGSASMDIDALLSLSTPPPASVEPEPTLESHTDVDFDEVIVPHLGEEPSADAFEPSEFNPLPPAPSPEPTATPTVAQAEPQPPVAATEDPDAQFAPLPSSGRVRRRATGEVPAVAQPEAAAEPGAPREQLPDWVSELNPSAGPTVLRIGDQEIRMQDKPLVEVANALRPLREKSKAVSAQKPATEGSVESGPLAGITDAIEVVPETAQPRTVIGPETRVISDLHAQRVRIVQNMLGLEEQRRKERVEAEDKREAKEAVVAPVRTQVKVDRFVVTLLLALAVIAPFLTGALIVPMPDTTLLPPAVASVSDSISQMKGGQSALVAFEYGPTGAGELDDLARVVIRAMIKQGVQPVIVSTNPSGLIHAQQLMAQFNTQPAQLDAMGHSGKPLVARQDYIVLRFLPGGVTGVHSLLTATMNGDFSQLMTQAIFKTDIEGKATNLSDISRRSLSQNPVYVLAESAEDVRNWVEQWNDPIQKLRIALLSSASASAVAQAYTTSDKRILGPMVGLRDAMVYQAQKQPVNDPKGQTLATERWQSIGLAALLSALIILFGTALNVIRNYQRRGRR